MRIFIGAFEILSTHNFRTSIFLVVVVEVVVIVVTVVVVVVLVEAVVVVGAKKSHCIVTLRGFKRLHLRY